MKVYIQDKKCIAYFSNTANSTFWDQHWAKTENLREFLTAFKDDNLFVPLVKKYVPMGSRVLEGGCGLGHRVHALQYQGYPAYGVDFASETIARLRQACPELNWIEADVKKLPFQDNTFGGYVSVGVIEHFFDGYDEILSEAGRVIKPEGFLFVSFPYMSPLRLLKSKLGGYKIYNGKDDTFEQLAFYQFALNKKEVQHKLEKLNFKVIESIPFDGIKGVKDEIFFLKSFLQPIYDGKKRQNIRGWLDRIFKPWGSHCVLLVAKKNN